MGKGLRSLIPEAPRRTLPEAQGSAPSGSEPPAPPPRVAIPQVDIDRIVPNERQPRERFDDESLEALAQSLKTQGLLQPILVRPLPDGRFGLVAGERRWRAAQRAGLLKVPAVIRDIPDDRLLEFALIENLQREELNPIEEASAYRALMQDLSWTQQQVAERVGKQRATVANAVRLLSLPEAVQNWVRKGTLSAGHARPLAALGSPAEQTSLADRAIREGLSVREVEARVARLQRARPDEGPARRDLVRKDPNVTAAEESLQRAVGTKVRIVQNRKGAGRLELHFYSAEELERLYQLLARGARGK